MGLANTKILLRNPKVPDLGQVEVDACLLYTSDAADE